jgi:hypothetical protein
MRRLTLLYLGFYLLPALANAQQAKAPDVWGPWRFLVGEWTAAASGEPGQGKGMFSFAVELQGKILVRRGRTDFPATSARPAFSHEDLLIVYAESGAAPNRAIYFDNEGHVIQYRTTFDAQGKVLTFLSESSPQAPRQRLTYTQNADGTLKVTFALAPPGKPEAFVTHVEGVAHPVRSKE